MIIWLAYFPKAEYEKEKKRNLHAASLFIVLYLYLHGK